MCGVVRIFISQLIHSAVLMSLSPADILYMTDDSPAGQLIFKATRLQCFARDATLCFVYSTLETERGDLLERRAESNGTPVKNKCQASIFQQKVAG